MNTWIALLRGINVGGTRKLPMKELVAIFEQLGATDVTTYIQSGNVVFHSNDHDPKALANRISDVIERNHYFRPTVMLVTIDGLERAVTQNRFTDAAPKNLHYYFLSAPPHAPAMDALDRLASESESYLLIDDIFYLHAPDGIGRSKLAASVEKLLGVEATARNGNTVRKVLTLAEALNVSKAD